MTRPKADILPTSSTVEHQTPQRFSNASRVLLQLGPGRCRLGGAAGAHAGTTRTAGGAGTHAGATRAHAGTARTAGDYDPRSGTRRRAAHRGATRLDHAGTMAWMPVHVAVLAECVTAKENHCHNENNPGDDHNPCRNLKEPARPSCGRWRRGPWWSTQWRRSRSSGSRLSRRFRCFGHVLQ
jgi:hypothetical protein